MRSPRSFLRVCGAWGLAALLLAGCGGDDDGGNGDPDDGDDTPVGILGDDATTYVEAAEASNGDTAGAEVTGYTLDAAGLAIEGTFEAQSPTVDVFRFNTGAVGGAGQPDLPGVDLQVIVDGVALGQTGGASVATALDAFANDGYSTLSGNKLINAAVTAQRDYIVRITPGSTGAAGKSYIIQLKPHE